MPCPFEQLGIIGVVGKACFVGMNSDARPDSRIFRFAVVLLRHLNRAVGGVGAIAVSDGEVSFDPVLFRARQHFGAVAVVALAFEMGVRVDEHQSLVVRRRSFARSCGDERPGPSGPSSAAPYLSLVPTGTSSRKLTSTGLPPSGEAATIMPFDSSPRTLRGARFATTTTLRPMSVSGA